MEMIRTPFIWPVHLWLTFSTTCEQRPWHTEDLMVTAFQDKALKGKEKGQGIEPQVDARRYLLPPSGYTGTKQVGEGGHSMSKAASTAHSVSAALT